jgi:GNAT superfamily N-acetyltransferase
MGERDAHGRTAASGHRPMGEHVTYRRMRADEVGRVAALVRRVHAAFVAPDESPEGRATFARYAAAEAMAARAGDHQIWLAEAGDALVGVLEVRGGAHVALLFVDGARQRRGIGRGLLGAAFGAAAAWPALTVNSTPDAVGAYERLGFVATAPPQEQHGLRFVPMRRAAGCAGAGAALSARAGCGR